MGAMDRSEPLSGVVLLASSLRVASHAHSGQLDALGAPYMGHVNRVMAYAEGFRARHFPQLDRFSVAAAAALHDVVEDSPITLEVLRAEGFPDGVLDAVRLLTHEAHVPRVEYLSSIAQVPLALVVKLGDTWDNADPVRLGRVASVDAARGVRLVAKYESAWRLLDGPVPLRAL